MYKGLQSNIQAAKEHNQIAQGLEHCLGDPNNPDAIMSYKRVMELDEQESFQEEFFQYLLSQKIHHYYVPKELGGKFDNYLQLYALGKVLARRDLATAVSMSTMVWSTVAWIGGNDFLKRRCAEITLSNNGAHCLAYSEETHGSDLLSNQLTAQETEGGFILNGEKWPINRAARSEVVMLLAKTSDQQGGRNLSLFMVEKSKLDCSTFSYMPKVKTHGLRGCDICGIRFSDAFIPKTALIGELGEGLELAIKAFQITRTLCSALSIGALENNLRVVMDFALHRQLYKKSVFEIPNAKNYLVGAFTDLLVTDALGTGLSRALHVIPKQFSVLSAVAKCFAPYKLDKAQKDLATVLGARFYLREKHKDGIFQKSLRDSQVVGLFDGSSEINLYSLSIQLPIIARRQIKLFAENRCVDKENIRTIFNEELELSRFDGQRLDLSSHGKDLIMESWPMLLEQLSQLNQNNANTSLLLELAENIFNKHQRNMSRVIESGDNRLLPNSPQLFNLARQYCIVHAAVCAIQYWINNLEHSSSFIVKADWLVVGLQRLLDELKVEVEIKESHGEQVADELKRRTEYGFSYALVAIRLPENNHEFTQQISTK